MRKCATILAILGAIFISTPAHAESAETTEATAQVAGIPTPEPRDAQGREIREPKEHEGREGRGLESEAIAIVVGSIFIAVGLAYGIGRRSKKD